MNISDMGTLVAEDHAFQRGMVVRLLRDLGVRSVAEAGDGRAALNLLTGPHSDVDLVICDLDMPEMDGMEFIRRVGENAHPVSVVLMSAHDDALISAAESMSHAYGVQLLGSIKKPVTRGRLAEMIGRHIALPARASAAPAGAATTYSTEEIRQGIANAEFEAFFQPKIALNSGSVTGAEALVRWRHPRDGIVPPAAFLPQVESSHLIEPLTWLMLQQSARACCAWHAGGFELSVAVNLSQTMLADSQFADQITDIVKTEGLAPQSMVLEITESAAMSDVCIGLENLTRLRMRGFGLAIDDYGTGFSSMQQLSRIPFTELKIDRSFVSGAEHSAKMRVMIETSLHLAARMGMKFVAEGVETRAEWDMLKTLGCDAAQGYFMSRPLDGPAFSNWLSRWTPPL